MSDLKRILMVEDNALDAELSLTALAEHKLANEVVVVQDGEQALDYMYRRGLYKLRTPGNPAVILLDLKLPKVDGLEVLQKLKSDPEMRSVPIVMLTSSREEPDLKRAYAMGVNAYMVKPVGFPDFLRTIREFGLFWAVVNQPPPGTAPPPESTP